MAEGADARDIDLVLVTGAGASREFGARGAKLPLMGDWVRALVGNLRQLGPGFAEVTGLSEAMGGEEFEQQLGRFLRSVESFGEVERLIGPISKLPNRPQGLQVSDDYWGQWYDTARYSLGQIVTAIHKSLYEHFAAQIYDERAAQQAYGDLFQQLVVGLDSRMVYATTNYDLVAERALLDLGYMPDAGDMRSLPYENEGTVRPQGLVTGVGRYVPLLHLHGRVGWLRRDDGRVVSQYLHALVDSPGGVPVVMLPDLEKSYDTDRLISAMWAEFGVALQRAKRVLVMGHSLHDEALLRALAAHVPMQLLGVTVLEDDDGSGRSTGPEADALRLRIQSRLPGATEIVLRFDADLGRRQNRLREWAQEIAVS